MDLQSHKEYIFCNTDFIRRQNPTVAESKKVYVYT